MRGNVLSRRGFVGGLGSALVAAVGGRALAGCSSPDVSVHIRRVDGAMQGGVAFVQASVVVTNHTQLAKTLPLHLSITTSAGAVIGTLDDTINVAPAELICHCEQITLPSYIGSMNGATLTITVGEESASATLGALGSTPVPNCDYTCNY